MDRLTGYLSATRQTPFQFRIRVSTGDALDALAGAIHDCADFRYSPILPAYPSPSENLPAPSQPSSISFFFARRPYYALGRLKSELSAAERDRTYFSQGLASILALDIPLERSQHLGTLFPSTHFEFWALNGGCVDLRDVVSEQLVHMELTPLPLDLKPTGTPETDVYLEQIAASLATLWRFHAIHSPDEQASVKAICEVVQRLITHHAALRVIDGWIGVQRQNAVISALVELSAALSYSVTQGTTGASPILTSPSPFPHHSLLGVGFAVRALTRFTRYLEAAFGRRSAAEVIRDGFPLRRMSLPRVSTFTSGPDYEAKQPHSPEDFDQGGKHPEVSVPLLTQFSLRHGFKESKFSVTAASESLTAETLPQWSLMTLSHEIMHSRVRDIFQALFGTTWDSAAPFDAWKDFYKDFAAWYRANDPTAGIPVDQAFRNLILTVCRAIAQWDRRFPGDADEIEGPDALFEQYRRHKMMAIELFAHFHDYYFAYACQPRLYVMAIWASWTKVAAPYLRPTEYLVRTLATIAAGSGSPPRQAFKAAVEQFEEALLALEQRGVRSPLFAELRRCLENYEGERTFALFKVAYYMLDHVRRWFSSRTISERIDRIESDPFAEGSPDASNYSASIYTHGGDGTEVVSPIRFTLASLVAELTGVSTTTDYQWLTAWHSLVIGSQEPDDD